LAGIQSGLQRKKKKTVKKDERKFNISYKHRGIINQK
jgi:hypothetical protein